MNTIVSIFLFRLLLLSMVLPKCANFLLVTHFWNRLIVWSLGSFNYNRACCLCYLLSSLIPSEYFCKEFFRSFFKLIVRMEQGKFLVSFDVLVYWLIFHFKKPLKQQSNQIHVFMGIKLISIFTLRFEKILSISIYYFLSFKGSLDTTIFWKYKELSNIFKCNMIKNNLKVYIKRSHFYSKNIISV